MLNKNLIKGTVKNDPKTLQKYSHDASLFEVQPRLVVFPEDVNDLKELVKTGLALTARSAGTDMTGGAIGESVIIDFTKHFNKIKKIGKDYAIVEPGVYYRDFEKATLKKGLLFPSYPASKEICAMGGIVANNAGGEKTLAYGKTENYVQQLKVVLADGNEYTLRPLNKKELNKKLKQKDFEGDLYRRLHKLLTTNYKLLQLAKPKVSKNSSGYALWNVWNGRTFDLTKLFTGAQGTLGLITEIKLRLIKPQKYSRLLIVFLHDIKPLSEIVNQTLRHKPESFESFDDNTLRLGMRYMFWDFALQFLPEIWMVAKSGFRFPKLVLLAEFTGNSEQETETKARTARADLQKFGLTTRITRSAKDTEKYWRLRRESFNLLRQKIKDKKTAPFIDDIIVRPELLPQFLPKLNKILNKYKITYTVAGHVGDGNFHIIPLMNLADPKTRKIIPELAKKVYRLVFEFGGSMSAEHNDGLIRTPFLQQMYGKKVYRLFQKIKNIFDPKNIFNPGKKVNGSIKYAFEHLKKRG